MEERLIKLNENIGDEQAIINKNEVEEIGYCRTCANGSDYFIPIFKDEGLSHELQSKVEKYLHIKITEIDILPVQLCYQCASTLLAWDTLVQGVQQAEQKLKQLLNQENSVEYKDVELFDTGGNGSIFIDTNDIDSDDEPLSKKQANSTNLQEGGIDCQNSSRKTRMRKQSTYILPQKIEEEDLRSDSSSYEDVENTDPIDVGDALEIPSLWLDSISCKHCGKVCTSLRPLKQHEKRETCRKQFVCSYCQKIYTKFEFLELHLKKHETDFDHKKYNCNICQKRFKYQDNAIAHMKICEIKGLLYPCSVCGKRCESKVLAEEHALCHHKSCVCHLCGQSFNKSESLKQHIKAIHDEFKMVCHYCGKRFTRKARLQEHLQRHTGQLEFTCHVCGRGSTNAYSFSVHLATHSQETPYQCSFCSRTFKHTKYVYLHERAVHLKLKSGKAYIKPKKPGKNVERRTCQICQKTFKRESAMLIHKRSVHEGKNGYICKLCGKDFKYTYLLYVHKKKHHFPELCKYVCTYCQKPFPVKTELDKHLRKHTGEKPFICGTCGKTYSFVGSLNMHIKTQHENKKNFKCALCPSSFNFRSHLARHMTAHVDKFQ